MLVAGRPVSPRPSFAASMVRLLVGALGVAAAAACSLPTADVMVVLGAQLVSNSSGAIVPGLSGDCRSSGAAMLYNYLDGKTPIVTSGGYLIGESFSVAAYGNRGPDRSAIAQARRAGPTQAGPLDRNDSAGSD